VGPVTAARFRYCADPLFLTCVALYAINRWLAKPFTDIPFFHGYFNDLLLIPCALPPLLWLHRALGLRNHDAPPTLLEIAAHWFVWSIVCEWIGPAFLPRTADAWDVFAYAAGAITAALWWQRPPQSSSSSPSRKFTAPTLPVPSPNTSAPGPHPRA
jgi:hypothetical protein